MKIILLSDIYYQSWVISIRYVLNWYENNYIQLHISIIFDNLKQTYGNKDSLRLSNCTIVISRFSVRKILKILCIISLGCERLQM